MTRVVKGACLLAVVLLGARTASAADDCLTPGYLARFNPALTVAQPCDPIYTADIHWGGRTAHLRAIKLRGVAMAPGPGFERRFDDIAAGVGHALDRMGGDLSLDDVTVLFTNYVSPREGTPDEGFDKGAYLAGAHRPGRRDTDCPVSYYKDRLRSTADDFVFTTAHEIFHCVQYANWRDMPELGWLTEGSAEYFAFLATSGYDGATELFTSFDAGIPHRTLAGMSYEAVVFYLWLSQTSGPPRVRELVAAARTIDSAIPPDLWIQFVTAYLDATIHFPDGRAVPSHPQIGGTISISATNRLDMPPAIPYTANSFDLAFARGHSFHLVYDSQPPDFRSLWRKTDGGAWGPPLTDVSTCDGPHTYRVAWATTASTTAGAIAITAADAAVGDSLCSLLGAWAMDGPSLERAVRTHEPRNACHVESGTIRLLFTGMIGGGPRRGAYQGSYIFDNLTYRCELSASAGGGWTRTRINGTARINWQVIERFLTLGVTSPGTPFGTVHRDTHTRERHYPNERGEDGVSRPLTKDEPLVWGFMGPFLGGLYRLSGNQLHFGAPPGYPLDDYAFDFTREAGR